MKGIPITALTLAALAVAAPASAGEPFCVMPVQQQAPKSGDGPRELLEQGMQLVLQALELMIRSVPQYAAPEVLENGDIIIRRLPSEPLPKSKPKTEGKERQI